MVEEEAAADDAAATPARGAAPRVFVCFFGARGAAGRGKFSDAGLFVKICM